MTTTNAAIYARVSTDEQKDNFSIPTQLDGCRKHAQERGYAVASEFCEDYTGTLLDRPELDKLRTLAKQGAIDRLIVLDLDRMARRMVHQLMIEEEFARFGVAIEYVNVNFENNAEGRFQKQIRSAVAELEREKLLERMKRGRLGRAKSGQVVPGGISRYGYRYVGDAEARKGCFEVVADEARIVVLVFTWYTIGDETGKKLSTRAIARKLSEMRVPTRFDTTTNRRKKKRDAGVWDFAVIASMLKDETYTGVWHFNKTVGETRKARDVKEWIRIDKPEIIPPIISCEMFEAAQRQGLENMWKSPGNVQFPYLMRKRLTCSCCGSALRTRTDQRKITPQQAYICNGINRSFSADGTTKLCRGQWRAERVDNAVWDYVKELLKHPETVLEYLTQRQTTEQAELTVIRERLADVEGKLAAYADERNRALNLYQRGHRTIEETEKNLAQISDMTSRHEIEARGFRAQLDRPDHISQETIDSVMARCAEMSEDIDDYTFEDKQLVIDSLKVTAIVTRGENADSIMVQGFLPACTIALRSPF